MAIKVNQGLNPIYETVFLLYFGYNTDQYRKMVVSQLNETGRNGEEIYQRQFKDTDKYISAFQKYKISGEKDSFFFQDTSMDFFISFVTPLFLNSNFIDEVDGMDNEQIFQILLENCGEIFEQDVTEYAKLSHAEFAKTETIMSFVNQFVLSENEKWKMLLIMQKPQEYYLCFTELIKKNQFAFKKAIEAVKTPMDKMLRDYVKAFSKEEKVNEFLMEFNVANCDINVITPTMITASSIIILINTCFFGLMAEKTLSEVGFHNTGKEYLQTCLKIFGDNSKLEILSILKVSPKYAAELAAQLGLTPATVSYHMSALITAKLVYVEKSGGKYYYHLNEASIKEVLELLRNQLIN